ncbi:MAG: molybdenum cofactor guanylyltransferase [Thermodesulfovibrionales bacterium]|nr:molybdenum cofactor guanylyltransferase [Thermodesulfovibrionales bacterium]
MTVFGKKITGAILAGGQNTRFPKTKGFIKIDGVSIIDKNLSLLHSLFDEVLISANNTNLYKTFEVPIIPDALPSRGPLTGIYSCLRICKSDTLFVIACDMPLIDREIVIKLCDCYLSDKPVGALVPVFLGKIHPLIGIYSKEILNRLERAILENKVMLIKFLQEIGAKYLDFSSIIRDKNFFNPFANINTPQDLEELKNSGFSVS